MSAPSAPYAATYADVVAAAARIAPFVRATPVRTSGALSRAASAALGAPVELLLKCELFQKTGSFKMRGAANAVLSLDAAAAARGVCTHSSGNHAAALAAAAAARGGCPATIVMPTDAPAAKRAAAAGYGAAVVDCAPGAAARAAAAAAVAARSGAAFVHPSEDARVIAGQGTVALELLAQAAAALGPPRAGEPALDAIVVPVGGGGLAAGCALAAAGADARVRVIGAEPCGRGGGGADAARALAAGALRTHADAGAGALETAADGLRTSLGPATFPILRDFLRGGIVVVTEGEIAAALRDVYARTKLAIEPSAAVGIAATRAEGFRAALGEELLAKGRPLRVGVVLCGGNADLAVGAEVVAGAGV